VIEEERFSPASRLMASFTRQLGLQFAVRRFVAIATTAPVNVILGLLTWGSMAPGAGNRSMRTSQGKRRLRVRDNGKRRRRPIVRYMAVLAAVEMGRVGKLVPVRTVVTV
jgi:hypothetical protein